MGDEHESIIAPAVVIPVPQCGALIGPEGEGCGVPVPCYEHNADVRRGTSEATSVPLGTPLPFTASAGFFDEADDSPPFKPAALTEFEARGYERINAPRSAEAQAREDAEDAYFAALSRERGPHVDAIDNRTEAALAAETPNASLADRRVVIQGDGPGCMHSAQDWYLGCSECDEASKRATPSSSVADILSLANKLRVATNALGEIRHRSLTIAHAQQVALEALEVMASPFTSPGTEKKT